MEDDIVVVAALGEGGEVVAGLKDNLSVWRIRRERDGDFESATRSLRTLGAWLL